MTLTHPLRAVAVVTLFLTGCADVASTIPSAPETIEAAPIPSVDTTATISPRPTADATPTDEPPMVSAAPIRPDEASCENAEANYVLAYPVNWVVLPPDAARGIPACAFFAAEPFDYAPDTAPGSGASVSVRVWEGGCLEFDMIDPDPEVLDEVTVGGLPAFRIHFRPPGALEHHSYLVNLSPDTGPVLGGIGVASCENSRALYIRSDGAGPGDYDLNRRVVDRMAATLRIDGD